MLLPHTSYIVDRLTVWVRLLMPACNRDRDVVPTSIQSDRSIGNLLGLRRSAFLKNKQNWVDSSLVCARGGRDQTKAGLRCVETVTASCSGPDLESYATSKSFTFNSLTSHISLADANSNQVYLSDEHLLHRRCSTRTGYGASVLCHFSFHGFLHSGNQQKPMETQILGNLKTYVCFPGNLLHSQFRDYYKNRNKIVRYLI
jgi:hypothetical protein